METNANGRHEDRKPPHTHGSLKTTERNPKLNMEAKAKYHSETWMAQQV